MKFFTWTIAVVLTGTTLPGSDHLPSDRDRINGQWNSVSQSFDPASLSSRHCYNFQDGSYERTLDAEYKGTIIFSDSINQGTFVIQTIISESYSYQRKGIFRQKGDLLELLTNRDPGLKVTFEERFQSGNYYQIWRRLKKIAPHKAADSTLRFQGDWELVFETNSKTIHDVVLSKKHSMTINGNSYKRKEKYFERGTFALNENTNPKQIDFYPEIRLTYGLPVFDDSSILAIYSFEESVLKIALEAISPGKKSRRPSNFQVTSGFPLVVSELKKTPN